MKVRFRFADTWDYLIPEELVDAFDKDKEEASSTGNYVIFERSYAHFRLGKSIEDIPLQVTLEDYVKFCPSYLPQKHEIIVNGEKFERDNNFISFSEVLELAGKEAKYNPTVTYSYANEAKERGILFWHQGIGTKEGTRFNVMYTGNA